MVCGCSGVSPSIPVSSTNIIVRHDITEIILESCLNTITSIMNKLLRMVCVSFLRRPKSCFSSPDVDVYDLVNILEEMLFIGESGYFV